MANVLEKHHDCGSGVSKAKKYPFSMAQQADAVVVSCSDQRFAKITRCFVEEELGIKCIAPIEAPGCVVGINAERAPSSINVLTKNVRFMLAHSGASRLIFIGHEDCKGYEDKISSLSPAEIIEQQIEDLREAARLFKKISSRSIIIEAYMALIDYNQPPTNTVFFEKIL
jgi:carbonic anhydrase